MMMIEGRTFYSRPQRTVFGATLLYREREGQRLKAHYFDVVSAVLTHDSWITIQWLKEIFACDVWQQFKPLQQLHFWMDNGPAHFRTGVTFHYLVNHVAEDAGVSKKLTINYFAENHGKSICDCHFSMISKALNEWTKEQRERTERREEEEEEEEREMGNVAWDSYDVARCLTAKFNYWKEKRLIENQHRKANTKGKKEWDYTILVRDNAPQQPETNKKNHTLPSDFRVYFHFVVTKLNSCNKRVQAAVWSSDSSLHSVICVVQNRKRKAETILKISSLPANSPVTSKQLMQRQQKRQKILGLLFFIFLFVISLAHSFFYKTKIIQLPPPS